MKNYWCPIENKFTRIVAHIPENWRHIFSELIDIKCGYNTYSHIPNKSFDFVIGILGFSLNIEIDFQGKKEPYYKVWGERNV